MEGRRNQRNRFEIAQDADDGLTAEAIGESIFTRADSGDELSKNVREAVQAFYFDSTPPASIRLRLLATSAGLRMKLPRNLGRRCL
jgi:hypothetical protein